MALSNLERVQRAFDALRQGLGNFIRREMEAIRGERWQTSRYPAGEPAKWVARQQLQAMETDWDDVFAQTLGKDERRRVAELIDTAAKVEQTKALTLDDTYRALDAIACLLRSASAPESTDIERQQQEVLRLRYEEQARREAKRTDEATATTSFEGLSPWRDVITPHKDVQSGRYQQAEFAADLWQVHIGDASAEYADPKEFFRRTYVTAGLRALLENALVRVSGKGGDPVVELQTNFGGGKTHSMLALYHLFSGVRVGELAGVDEIATTVANARDVDVPPHVKRAVLVGNKIAPGQPQKKDDGTIVQTLWGELAYQLGGAAGYALIRDADVTSTNPGDALRVLLKTYAPCLILIDEWVGYARQLHDTVLPGGTFDTHMTFAQTISEAAKAVPGVLLVVSIPSSDNEIGGERGHRALNGLKNAIGRVESPWRPASADEGFEIVRRRLFEPLSDPKAFVARDAVCQKFAAMYRGSPQEFPDECRKTDYERRLRSAYPIHPELFDRFYGSWSTLDRFQRTRGVLRLMAAVIHHLWAHDDRNLLIMPSSIPLHDARIQNQLLFFLEEGWAPVIDTDVDGPQSVPRELDAETPHLGRHSACRRVARTVFMGSAPTLRAANRGIEDRDIKLGCIQPGEPVAAFGDALRRLTDATTYLYVSEKRFWYSTQPSVARLAQDRAAQLDIHDVHEDIRRRLREATRDPARRGDFPQVPVAPTEVPDERDACRLVIIDPEYTHIAKSADSSARRWADVTLQKRGTAPRQYLNTLVFLAADESAIRPLEQAVREAIAWGGILKEQHVLGLDPFQMKQAEAKKKAANETIDARLPEAYSWLLVPVKGSPDAAMEIREIKNHGSDDLAIRAGRKLREQALLVSELGPTTLRHHLDKVPLWRGDHVTVAQLAEDFARYVYLPRLTSLEVLRRSIEDGARQPSWAKDTFAYAERHDANRYKGLSRGDRAPLVETTDVAVVVKADVAIAQIRAETPDAPIVATTSTIAQPPHTDGAKRDPRRFWGAVELDPAMLGRAAGQVGQEIVSRLSHLPNAEVRVTLQIEVTVPDGVPETEVRNVTENARTLKFNKYGFEE